EGTRLVVPAPARRAPQLPPRLRYASSRRHDPDRVLPSKPPKHQHREAHEADVVCDFPAGPERVGALDAEAPATRRLSQTEGRGFEPLRACARRFSRPVPYRSASPPGGNIGG